MPDTEGLEPGREECHGRVGEGKDLLLKRCTWRAGRNGKTHPRGMERGWLSLIQPAELPKLG